LAGKVRWRFTDASIFQARNPIPLISPNQLIRIQSFDKMLKIQWSGINIRKMMYENP